jgi:tetratricopeptide (TPR) repeat protein
MPEHTIPASLIERIRNGRAALVVGAGLGIPSWKQILESMNEELKDDEASYKDVAKLLHKGNLVRAAGFLARKLGEETCDRIVQQAWQTPDDVPDVLRAIAKLPFKALWTSFPGDLIEHGLAQESPSDWPAPNVYTYGQIDELDRRRRYVLKILGDFDAYIVTPKSVRRALASRTSLREFVRELYVDGALVFVGFRFGDPDLGALLDRVFGTFEPPESEHYLIASGVGPVTVDELHSEHHISVVNLPGKGADETATAALIGYLGELADACGEAGISLAATRPDADDLEGWLHVLGEDDTDAEAVAAIELLTEEAREQANSDRLIEILMGRTEVEPSAARRADMLREVAGVFQNQVGDLPKAFTALTVALREDPSNTETLEAAEALAAETDGWTELVTDVAEIAGDIEDPITGAAYWARLGKWYDERLHHYDYAIAAYRQAVKLDSERLEAHTGLEEVFRKQQRWAELAEVIQTHLEIETDGANKVDLYLSLGDLYETQLASTSRAIDAYQAAVDLDDSSEDSLAALERLYRRDERWGRLAKVLERRAELFEQAGDSSRAGVVRHELGALRADKLGDLEGAISKYESTVAGDPGDIDSLRALEELYEKSGRTEDYQRTLHRLVDVVPESERPGLLRRLGAELAESDEHRTRAIEYYERLLDLEPNAEDAFRALERAHRKQAQWYELVGTLERHIAAVHAPGPRVELYTEMADVYETELEDPHRAIEAHLNALAIQEEHRLALTALARLYKRVEAWDRAADILTKHAALEGAGGAELWHEAGGIAAAHMDDLDLAERWFEKSLELHPNFLPAMLSVAEMHKRRRNWANAMSRLREAEKYSQNRLERIQLLAQASDIAEEQLDDSDTALELQRNILDLDPEHIEAGVRVSERLVATERWADAEPILEMLARRVEDDDRVEKARREALLGKACEKLAKTEKAAKHYRLAVEADPDSLEAALGLASMEYEAAKQGEDEDAWREVDRRYREILARHRTNLADGQVVETWHRVGVAARALGDDKKADNAFRRALERDPHHRTSLLRIIEVGESRGDWKTVVEAKRDLIEGSDEHDRIELFGQIGDIYARELNDPVTALGAYLEAIKMDPTSHVLLHKTLDIYSQQKQWRRAIETLGAIAATEGNAQRRAKYRYAAAVIARDELQDVDIAVDNFNEALDDDPTLPKAFDAIDQLLTDNGDWRNLARSHRKMLKRVGEDAPTSQLLKLWTRLGDVCVDHLGDNESAIAAYEVASSLDPKDIDRHEQLANLYLEAGDERREDAIEELQILVQAYPERVELYRALADLYFETEDLDKAYCLSQALVFLGAANERERALYERLRPKKLSVAKRRLTEELWQKAIIHQREDRHLNAIFGSLVASIAATTAQPASSFKLNPSRRANTQTDSHVAARVFGYAANVLGLDPVPSLYLTPESDDGIRVANTAEKGKLAPSVLLGSPQLDKQNEGELAFDVGKRLAFFRPERYVNYALQTLPKIESAFKAALAAAGQGDAAGDPDTAQLATHIKKTVPSAVLDQVSVVAHKMGERRGNGVVAGWRSATDLTANRVGLILCNDFEIAARLIATEAPGQSTISAKDRLRDLLAYSVSEQYFQVRRHLGLVVSQEG